jgi:hypothetical protein
LIGSYIEKFEETDKTVDTPKGQKLQQENLKKL